MAFVIGFDLLGMLPADWLINNFTQPKFVKRGTCKLCKHNPNANKQNMEEAPLCQLNLTISAEAAVMKHWKHLNQSHFLESAGLYNT